MPKNNACSARKKTDATQQFNVKIKKRVVKMMKDDARKFSKSLDSITEKVLTWFLTTKSTAERGEFYRSIPNKIKGRSIK